MKKLLPIILPFFSLAVTAQSPISILSTDMAQIGDVINRKADTMTVLTGPGPAGPNQTWVMTNLSSSVNDEITSVVTVASTPYASSFSTSNVAMTNDNVSYIYMNRSNSTLTTQGGAGDLLLLGSIITAPLSPDLTLHNFPRNYNNNFSDNYATDITIAGSIISPLVSQIRYKRIGVVKDTTDGWGTITTPVGTYNTLRVKRVDFSTDSIWIKPVFPPTWSLYSNKKDTSYSYTWLAKETKLAVAELGYDSLDQPKTFKWSLIPPLSVSIDENVSSLKSEVYPIPASDYINLRFGNDLIEDEYFFTVYDALGKILMTEEIHGSASIVCNFSIEGLCPGFYNWELSDPKQLKKSSGKISVVR